MDFDDILKEFEIGNEGAGYTQPASSNDPLAEYEINQDNGNGYNEPQSIDDYLSDYEIGSTSETSGQSSNTPEYSVQEAAQQANGGQSYLNTAVGEVTGEQQDPLSLFEKPEIKTTPERDALIEQLKQTPYDSSEYAGYATDELSAAQIQDFSKRNAILDQLRAIDKELGNGEMDYTALDRAGSVFSNANYQIASGLTNAAGTVTRGVGEAINNITDGERGQKVIDVGTAMQNMSDNMSAAAQRDVERAKNGLSRFGQAGVDIATNVIQMGFDAAVGAATGGGSLASMFLRSAGNSMQNARNEGASTLQQLAYGGVSGGIEVFTEKLADGVAGIYGKGAADDITEALIRKLSDSDFGRSALRLISGAVSEGGEEVISDLLAPYAELIYNGKGFGETLRGTFNGTYDPSEVLYDFIIGAAIGALGGGTSVMTGQNANANAQLREADTIQNNLVQNNGMNDADARKAADILAKVGRGEEITKKQSAFLDTVQKANGIDTSQPNVSAPQAQDTESKTAQPEAPEPEVKPQEQPSTETPPEQPTETPTAENPTIPETPQESAETPSDELNSEPGENPQPQPETTAETGETSQAEEETASEESASEEDATAEAEAESTTGEAGERIPPRPPQQPTNQSTSSDYSELGEDYGTMEQGEKAEREANTPKRTAPGNKVSQSVNTVQEAKATPESRLPDIQSAVAEGKTSFVPIKNSERATNAETKIKDKGWSSALKDWTAAVRSGQANADLVAEGAVLLNNAGNNPNCTGAEYIDLMLDYVRLNRTMGQGLQAARILKTLSPEGKLYAFQKVVQNMNEQAESKSNGSKKGKAKTSSTSETSDVATQLQESTGNKYNIPEELIEKYRQQTDDAGRDAVIDEMQQAIADQIPSTLKDKFTAIRYLNMLGNFKTQARNILGNTGMLAVQKAKNVVRSAAETIAQAATGGKYEKQYSTFYGTDLWKAGLSDIKQNADLKQNAMGEKKYSSVGNQYAQGIDEKRNVFKFGDNKLTRALGIEGKQGPLGKLASKYNDITSWAMEMGDEIFVTANYADALAGYLKAHKITAEQWTSLVAEAETDASSDAAETVDKARQFAIKQAQEATFRDTNKVSEFAQNFDKNWGKARLITEGIVPFRKTPANVGVRMEEYSPLGLINTAYKALQASKGNGNVTGADVIDSLSKSLTGSGLALLGFTLAQAGRARTKSDDDKQESFDKLRGLQDYSINIGGTNLTFDWAVPAASSLFMGVELYNLMQDGDLSPDDAMRVIGNLTSPMLEMSMLSGVNDALSNIASFNDDTDALPQFILNSAWGYITQGLTNTLLGQIEQGSEQYRQTYYTDPENPLIPTSLQKKLAQAGNKTPGIDYQAADYIDAWGRKQENFDNPLYRYAYALASPAYISGDKSTAVDTELQRLYNYGKNNDDFPNVLPKQTSRSTEVNGKRLTADEYETYATTKGEESLRLITELINSKFYDSLDDDAKAEAIQECYSYAKYLAEDAISKSRNEENKNTTYDNLMTGVDKSGTQYDKTALNPNNFTAYTALKTGLDKAVESGDYKAIDKIVTEYNRQNNNLKTVLSERNPTLRALANWKNAGLGSQDYYSIQKELVNSQKKLDKSQKTGSVVELDALANSNIPESKKRQLINALPDYTSKTVKGVYNTLADYGFDSKTINAFWNQSQDWVYKDTGAGQSSQKQGTLQPLEAAYAISQLPGLTEAQRTDIYNKLKEIANVPYAINDWKNYSYRSEVNYLASGKSKQEFGKSSSSTQQSSKPPSFANSKFMKGK